MYTVRCNITLLKINIKTIIKGMNVNAKLMHLLSTLMAAKKTCFYL